MPKDITERRKMSKTNIHSGPRVKRSDLKGVREGEFWKVDVRMRRVCGAVERPRRSCPEALMTRRRLCALANLTAAWGYNVNERDTEYLRRAGQVPGYPRLRRLRRMVLERWQWPIIGTPRAAPSADSACKEHAESDGQVIRRQRRDSADPKALYSRNRELTAQYSHDPNRIERDMRPALPSPVANRETTVAKGWGKGRGGCVQNNGWHLFFPPLCVALSQTTYRIELN
ncbi:hypothetical protein C8J57DRAFT_1479828 [Mycena rebaudengoi]|nr:hypothetical protein C8J57DRAFT_1479828 [Mycena rebaudengoi]